MTGTLPTTSFGRRAPSLAQTAAEARTRLEAARTPEPIHKWRLHRTLVEARAAFALPDGALNVLHALLSFHPETALTLDRDDPAIIVFPSNRELLTRAGGPSEPTLRRHIARLIAAGLIARRDSPNGKRYVRRDGEGETLAVFGFDLAPFVAARRPIEIAAAEIRAEGARVRLLKEKIAILRRNCAGALIAIEDAGWPSEALATDLAKLSGPTRRITAQELEARSGALESLADRLDSAMTRANIKSEDANMSGNAAHIERHIQNQIQTSTEFEPASEEAGGEVRLPPKTAGVLPLGLVAKTFPTLCDYARGGRIDRPADLIDAANLARAALGVSPSAWAEAQETMGQGDAAIAVAAMLERADEIRSAGGYLRALTAKAKVGTFAAGPLVMAQMKRATITKRG